TGGPMMLGGELADIVYTNAEWMVASHGSAKTSALSLGTVTGFFSKRSMSGEIVAAFAVNGKWTASRFDGAGFAASIQSPCTDPSQCEVRAAGDGHLWVLASGNLYEEVGSSFENRGGAPVGVSVFDVNATGDVFVGAANATSGDEVFQIWELPRGA